ncbi:unnamed protein product [Cylicocyclus nassatus]|uniref:Uncharacterized protein n=1 Tax=Cylicocyclus nassatus TaxID=53992 RepID=A0AA36HAQ3_CYLNA|nr:unnamed protein product [Cylicocyclus nassatus]
MEWAGTALKAYTDAIDEIYSIPLKEQCTKIKAKQDDKNEGAEPVKGEHDQLIIRLKEAASKVTEWSNSGSNQTSFMRNREVSLAEMAAMYRLRTLVSMSADLVEVIARAKMWTKLNLELIEKFRTIDVLPMSLTIFEATCALGEIFHLKSIDRSAAKSEYKRHLRARAEDDYRAGENKPFVIGDAKSYIPPLEAQINYYRTCVHLIGSALITMIQTYMNSISLEQLDLRTREVKDLLDRLPPMYLKIKTDIPLSKNTAKLLEDYPPNKLQFPLAPLGDKKDNVCRSGKVVRKDIDEVQIESTLQSDKILKNGRVIAKSLPNNGKNQKMSGEKG